MHTESQDSLIHSMQLECTHKQSDVFMVAFSQQVFSGLESDGEVEVCVTALSPPSQLSVPASVEINTQSSLATDTGT